MAGGLHRISEGAARFGPKHCGGQHRQVGGWQNQIDPQPGWPGWWPACAMQGRIAATVAASALSAHAFRQRVLQARILEKGLHRIRAALAIGGVHVAITDQHEATLGRGGKAPIQIEAPESGFIVVASSIAVLGAVEDRGRGVEGQKVNILSAYGDGYGPMAGGRQALHRKRLWRQQGLTIRQCQQSLRQVAPEQGAVILYQIRPDRMHGQDRHTPLPGEVRISLGIARAANATIPVKIKPGRQSTVRRQRIDVWIKNTSPRDRIAQRPKGDEVMVIIDVKQQQDIRCGMGDHGNDRLQLWIAVPPDVAQQQPRPLAGEVGVKDGDIKRFGPNNTRRKCRCQAEEQKKNNVRPE